MKRFNEEVYTGSPNVNLSCFREFDELERCLRYSDLEKFMVCASQITSRVIISQLTQLEIEAKYRYWVD